MPGPHGGLHYSSSKRAVPFWLFVLVYQHLKAVSRLHISANHVPSVSFASESWTLLRDTTRGFKVSELNEAIQMSERLRVLYITFRPEMRSSRGASSHAGLGKMAASDSAGQSGEN